MKKISPNQSGFSAPHILLLLVVVAIIGGTGYFVYSAQRDTKQTLDSVNTSAEGSATTNTATSKKAAADAVQSKEQAAPTSTEAPVVFVPDGKFTATERADLQTKLITPIKNHYKDKLASIMVQENSPSLYVNGSSDDKYLVTIIEKAGGYSGFLYGSKTSGNPLWQPLGP